MNSSSIIGLLKDNEDTLQQMALLAWLKNGDESKHFLEAITTAKVCSSMYNKISSENEIEAARTLAIVNIAKFVKENPRSRQNEIQNVVLKEIETFRQRIQHC